MMLNTLIMSVSGLILIILGLLLVFVGRKLVKVLTFLTGGLAGALLAYHYSLPAVGVPLAYVIGVIGFIIVGLIAFLLVFGEFDLAEKLFGARELKKSLK